MKERSIKLTNPNQIYILFNESIIILLFKLDLNPINEIFYKIWIILEVLYKQPLLGDSLSKEIILKADGIIFIIKGYKSEKPKLIAVFSIKYIWVFSYLALKLIK